MTTPLDEDRIPGPVLPTAAMIGGAEATTTTSTESVASHQPTSRPGQMSHQRTRSKNVVTAFANLSVAPAAPVDCALREQQQKTPAQDRSTEGSVSLGSSYEAFPSFDSYPSRSRFSLTRSLSLGRGPKASPLKQSGTEATEPRRSLLFRTWTGTPPPGPAKTASVRERNPLEVTAEKDARIGGTLSKTHICLWAGPWRRKPSGEFVCPCGDHEVRSDEASLFVVDEAGNVDGSQVGGARKERKERK